MIAKALVNSTGLRHRVTCAVNVPVNVSDATIARVVAEVH